MKTKLDFFANGQTGVKQKGSRNFLQTVVPIENDLVYMTDDEICSSKGTELVMDIECYLNYFLICFRHVKSNKVIEFRHSESEYFNIEKLRWICWQYKLITFNGNKYDIPILNLAMRGSSTEQLKKATSMLIVDNLKLSEFYRIFKFFPAKLNHIDLIEVAPLSASLKMYAARLHCKRLQELPYDPEKILSNEEQNNVKDYCHTDTENTLLLYEKLIPQIQLREELSSKYKQDLRSKSDAQIAEAVIVAEIAKLTGDRPKRPIVDLSETFTYSAPAWVCFQTQELQQMLNNVNSTAFGLDAQGSPILPTIIDKAFKIGNGTYQMSFGGLHSKEKQISHFANEDVLLIDFDVASHYPRIILNERFFPKHLGEEFLTVFDTLVKRRLEGKRTKNAVVADSLKIVINGAFGKLGSIFSVLYSPLLMIQTTLTGQLSLLMLIEAAELMGIPVISANTDGVIFKCPKNREKELQDLASKWAKHCGFEIEETRYKSTHNRDVNNFIAIKEDGEIKVKGCYSEKGSAGNSVLSKNPDALICADAAKKFITENVPIEKTITECKDIRRFVVVRQVKGGGAKDSVYLGKVVRWYYAKGQKGSINYVGSGNKVNTSNSGKPCMILPKEIPSDIDYEKYIADTEEILYEIGYKERPQTQIQFW